MKLLIFEYGLRRILWSRILWSPQNWWILVCLQNVISIRYSTKTGKMLRDVKWRQSLFYCLILNHCLIVKSKNNRYCLIRFFILLNRSGSRLWAIICPAYRFKYRLYPIKSALTRLQNISILARKELKFILLDPSYKWLKEMTSSFYKDQITPWITFLKHCKSYAILMQSALVWSSNFDVYQTILTLKYLWKVLSSSRIHERRFRRLSSMTF